MRLSPRLLICFVVVFALVAGTAYAGCGKKETNEGALTSIDAATKTVVVKGADGKEVKLTLTATTDVKDAEGNKVDVSTLVGKNVKVISEHQKVDSISQTA